MPFQIIEKLDEKILSLVKVIDTTIDIFILKVNLEQQSIPIFDEEYMDAQMEIRKLKKT